MRHAAAHWSQRAPLHDRYVSRHDSETAPSESDSSEADSFEQCDSEISDTGDSEPDGESIGSEDSETSSDGSDHGESDEESVVYETEQEEELDRLDAKADQMEAARTCKRRRMA